MGASSKLFTPVPQCEPGASSRLVKDRAGAELS